MTKHGIPVLLALGLLGASLVRMSAAPESTRHAVGPARPPVVSEIPAEGPSEPHATNALAKTLGFYFGGSTPSDRSLPGPPTVGVASDPDTGRLEHHSAYSIDHMRSAVQRVARLLTSAYRMFEEERLELCIGYCDEILSIDPGYPVAIQLKAWALKARHVGTEGVAWAETLGRWKRVTSDDEEEVVIPETQFFRFPSREEWAEMSSRESPSGWPSEWEAEQVAIRRKLDQMLISLEFIKALPEDVLAYIRDYSGLNIIMDAAVRGAVDPDVPITIVCRDMPLGHALNLVLAYSGKGLVPRVTEEHVVLLMDPTNPSNY